MTVLVSTVALGLFLVGPVSAQGNNLQPTVNPGRSLPEKQQEQIQEKQKKARELSSQTQKNLQAKQAEAKKNICEKIKDKTKNKHDHIKTTAAEIASRIDQRVERAKSFVTSKNLQVANYDSLVADINAKKQTVSSSQSAIASAAAGFDCTNDNRKAQEAIIREKVEAYKVAVKAYKQSVKTFLQAVRSAAQSQSPTSSQNSSGSR